MGRSPCCSKVGLRRGPWSAKEDNLLANYIQQHGEGQWRSLPKKAGLLRCGKSCRLRWMNYLRPGIKRGNISQDEEDLIVRLHELLGNRWSLIAGRLPGRTDNEIKNHWNTHLLKKLNSAGIHHKMKPNSATKPKKKHQRTKIEPPPPPPPHKSAAEDHQPNHDHHDIDGGGMITSNNKTTKVYLPKAIRVSSAFSRSSSYDSLVMSGASSSEEAVEKTAEVVSYVPWPPLFELDQDVADGCGGGGDDFLRQYRHCDSISGDVDMWEKVYDEYLHLLEL